MPSSKEVLLSTETKFNKYEVCAYSIASANARLLMQCYSRVKFKLIKEYQTFAINYDSSTSLTCLT